MNRVEKVMYNSEYNRYLDRKINEDPDFFCKEFRNLTDKMAEEYKKKHTEKIDRNMEYYEEKLKLVKERMACQLLREHGYAYEESYVFGLTDVRAFTRWE